MGTPNLVPVLVLVLPLPLPRPPRGYTGEMRFAIAMGLLACLSGCGGSDSDDVEELPDVASIDDLWAFTAADVWAVGADATLLAYDGVEWSPIEVPTSDDLTGIFARTPNDIWITGAQSIVHWDGNRFTVTETTPFGLDGVTDVWAVAPDKAWAVGDDGILLYWDGTAWWDELFPSTFNQAIWGWSPDDLYVLSSYGLYHWDGGDWVSVDTGAGGGEGDIWGTGPSDVWVATGDAALAHFDGEAWTVVDNEEFVGGISGLWGDAADDVWGVGPSGTIAHFDGERWSELDHDQIGSIEAHAYRAVHGTATGTDLWAVGQRLGEQQVSGVIYHYRP